MNIQVSSIGTIKCLRRDVRDDFWGGVQSIITLNEELFDESVTRGLEQFSHIEIIYYFHKVADEKIETKARHPRNNQNWPKVGIFAQRAKARPNRLGLTTCKLLSVDGLSLTVEGLDAIDGTPVIDIKPYMKEFSPREETTQPKWSTELMENYFVEQGTI